MSETPAPPMMIERRWLGQLGESGDTAPAPGPRVSVHRWLEDGEQGEAGAVRVTAMIGDGRLPGFRRLHVEELPPAATEEDLLWAIDRCHCALIAKTNEKEEE